MNDQNRKVWINIPYDEKYLPFRHAIDVVLWMFKLEPVFADAETRSQIRLEKIMDMIASCQFGITEVGGGPRSRGVFVSQNMPFEHGVMWQLSHQNVMHKPILICRHRHDPDIWFSNVRGTDALGHQNRPELLIKKLHHWITTDGVVFGATGLARKELALLTPDVITGVWRSTLTVRSQGADIDDLRDDIQSATAELIHNGYSIIAGDLVAPDDNKVWFPRGFRRSHGFELSIKGRKFCVPFVLYAGLTTSGRSFKVTSSWQDNSRFQLSENLRDKKQVLLREYEEAYGKYGEDEDVTRLESIRFQKRKPAITLTCKRLGRWDVVATNWMLDRPCFGGQSLRTQYRINSEILTPSGLDTSELGNTLGLAVILGNRTDRQVLLSRRSGLLNHPFPEQIKVSAGGEIRRPEWKREGPDVFAAAKRLIVEEVGLPFSVVKQINCIGLGRSAVDAVPELLFEAHTDTPLDEIPKFGRLQSWQRLSPTPVSYSTRNPQILSWLSLPGLWSPQHFACCGLYLLRHAPKLLKK